MNNQTAAKFEASPAVVKAMGELLEMHRQDVIEKQQSVAMEMIKGLSDRMQRIEEKLDSLISSSPSNLPGPPGAFKPSPFFTQPRKLENSPFAATQIQQGKQERMVDRTSLMDNDRPFKFSGRGRGLFVGGALSGGRCGGLGFCGDC
ncbi:unnamed protein product [Microthlaspi erraticum]|uniref:Uncharacterized protein n=1 Tax=Microthlaspi erraticum TaxID=1685480 RepID=A0A6D2I0Z0_9BRAS|nr:unnamed protein product [Microthlaspi erraticum]